SCSSSTSRADAHRRRSSCPARGPGSINPSSRPSFAGRAAAVRRVPISRAEQMPSEFPAPRVVSQLRQRRHRLDEDLPRHLALTGAPIDEDDRDLLDDETTLGRAERELDLERVALGANLAELDRLERAAREALVARREVLDAEAEDHAAVEASAL